MAKKQSDIQILDAVKQLNHFYKEIAVFNVTKNTYRILKNDNKDSENTVIPWNVATDNLLKSGVLHKADYDRWLPYAQAEFWEKDPFSSTNCVITAVRTLKDGIYRWRLIEFSPTPNYSRDNLEIFFMFRDIHDWFAPLYDYRQSMEHALQADYSSVYYVDLDHDSFTIKHFANSLRDSVREAAKQNRMSYTKAISQYVADNVVLSEQDYILRVLSKAYIIDKFKTHNDFVVNYRVKPNPEGQEYFELHVIKVSENEVENKAFIAFRCIDETMNETIRKDQFLLEAQEAAKEKQDIISSLADIYISLHYIDLENNSFVELKANDHIRKLLDGVTDINTAFELKAEHMADLEYKHPLLDFFNLRTLSARLRAKNIISMEFHGKYSGWCRANFIPVKKDARGNVTHALYMVQPIDEEKTKELNYQKALKDALANTNTIFREVLEMQSCGIVAYDPNTLETIAFNKAALDIYDLSTLDGIDDIRGELLTRSLHLPINMKANDMTPEELIYQIDHIIETKKAINYEMSVPHADGTTWDILAQANTIELANGKTIVTHSLTNITETKQLERKLRKLSEIDSLTHIKNRGYGEQLISDMLSNKEAGMFCLFDIDNFKQINDRFGHATGDFVLVEVANCLTATFPDDDVVMRLGGDEFAIYSTHYTSESSASKLLDELQQAISRISYHEEADCPISISMGVVLYDATPSDFDTIYRKADSIMYRAKRDGKGNIYFDEP